MFANPEILLAAGPNVPLHDSSPPARLDTPWERSNDGRYCGHLSLLDLGTHEKDIAIDTCGAAIILSGIALFYRRRNPNQISRSDRSVLASPGVPLGFLYAGEGLAKGNWLCLVSASA